MGITSSVGLVSGIDSGALIDQLIAIDSRPRLLVQRRIAELQQQNASYLAVNSSALQLQTVSAAFNSNDVFQSAAATSSNDSVLTATASSRAAVGTYQFTVDRLVSTQARLSKGFADPNTTGLGLNEFSIEDARGGVTTETRLTDLNGGAGVDRGSITITDRAGNSQEVDLSRAVTLNDVLDEINSQSSLGIEAIADGDKLVIRDTTGSTTSNLIIESEFGASTAEDLGIATSSAGVAANEVEGNTVFTLSGSTAVSALNDGLGIVIRNNTTDFRITDRDGNTVAIDLGKLEEDALESEFEFEGNTYAAGTLVSTIPNYSSIAADDRPDTEKKTIQNRPVTMQDVVDIINQQASDDGVSVTASIDSANQRLILSDSSGGIGNLIIEEGSSNTNTAESLGILTDPLGVASNSIEGDRLLAGINTVLTRNLNGGNGLTSGAIDFTDRNGLTTSLNLNPNEFGGSLDELINTVNQQLETDGNTLRISVNSAGNGLEVSDIGSGLGNFSVAGTLADELGVTASNIAGDSSRGTNLQKKWVGLGTSLDVFNAGEALGNGTFRITDGTGQTASIEVSREFENVSDFLDFLNSRPNISIEARLNETGDGIVIEDTSGGPGELIIEDESGTFAASIGIAGEFEDPDGAGGAGAVANARLETVIDLDPGDTLDDLVTAINNTDSGLRATTVNDGSGLTPWRLNLTSRQSGVEGRLLVDSGTFDFGFTTLDQGNDAVVFYGSADPKDAVLLTSSSNTLDDVVPGVTIDLNSADPNETITLNVARDTDAIESAVSAVVTSFNALLQQIRSADSYDEVTETKGPLLGDSTVRNLERRLFDTIQGRARNVDSSFNFFFEIGVKVGEGARLEFDRDRFRSALEQDFDGVQQLVAGFEQERAQRVELSPGVFDNTPQPPVTTKAGLAVILDELMESYTNSLDGVLTTRQENVDELIRRQEDRVESLDAGLARKRARLEAQFLAMEQALGQLQQQQSSLAGLPQGGGVIG